MNIGGKEFNRLASLTTSEQNKATTNLVQSLDPIQNFLALKLCNNLYLISKYIKLIIPGHCNNFFEISAKLLHFVVVRYLEPLFSFCRLIASMLDSYSYGLLECKIEMAVPSSAQLVS
nr:hypothetical protein CFP56_30586 [Quercus suber]